MEKDKHRNRKQAKETLKKERHERRKRIRVSQAEEHKLRDKRWDEEQKSEERRSVIGQMVPGIGMLEETLGIKFPF